MIILKYSLAIFCLLLTGCSFFSSHKEKESTPLMEYEHTTEDIQPREECSTVSPPERSEMALYMDSLGLVNIADLDSSLVVKLMYTQADNFHRRSALRQLNGSLPASGCGIRSDRSTKNALKRLHPSYSLIIYDAARPMSVQKKMWKVVKGTSKYKYVSNPNRGGGLHNYGLAVDISIQDSLGQPHTDGNQSRPLRHGTHTSQTRSDWYIMENE